MTKGAALCQELQDFGWGQPQGDAVLSGLKPGFKPGEINQAKVTKVVFEDAVCCQQGTDTAYTYPFRNNNNDFAAP